MSLSEREMNDGFGTGGIWSMREIQQGGSLVVGQLYMGEVESEGEDAIGILHEVAQIN